MSGLPPMAATRRACTLATLMTPKTTTQTSGQVSKFTIRWTVALGLIPLMQRPASYSTMAPLPQRGGAFLCHPSRLTSN